MARLWDWFPSRSRTIAKIAGLFFLFAVMIVPISQNTLNLVYSLINGFGVASGIGVSCYVWDADRASKILWVIGLTLMLFAIIIPFVFQNVIGSIIDDIGCMMYCFLMAKRLRNERFYDRELNDFILLPSTFRASDTYTIQNRKRFSFYNDIRPCALRPAP